MRCLLWLRTIFFYIFFAIWTVSWCSCILFTVYFIPFNKRHFYAVNTYSSVVIWACKWICGLSWKIEGKENIPEKACVVASNHQSTWETLFLQTIFTPQATVLKKELLKIPFFGWALRTLDPISINRQDPKKAIKQMNVQGKVSLNKNRWVMVFPEGTRYSCKNLGRYTRGAATLALKSNVSVLPIVHNAGKFWPNKKWLKKPGEITLRIGPLISSTNATAKEINDKLVLWSKENLPK